MNGEIIAGAAAAVARHREFYDKSAYSGYEISCSRRRSLELHFAY